MQVSTKTLSLRKSDDGRILYGELLTEAKLTLKNAKENSLARASLLDADNPIPYICNIKKINTAEGDARAFMSKDTAGLSCVALVVESNGISKIIADYALWINRPVVPTKIFTTIQSAERWAVGFA